MYLHEKFLIISARRASSRLKIGKASTDAGFLSAIFFDLYLNKRIFIQDDLFVHVADDLIDNEVLSTSETYIRNMGNIGCEFSILVAELLPLVPLLKKKCITKLVNSDLMQYYPRTEFLTTEVFSIYGLQKWNEIYRKITTLLELESEADTDDFVLIELCHHCDLYLNYYESTSERERVHKLMYQLKYNSKWQEQFSKFKGIELLREESKFIILSAAITSITGFELNFTHSKDLEEKLVRKLKK